MFKRIYSFWDVTFFEIPYKIVETRFRLPACSASSIFFSAD